MDADSATLNRLYKLSIILVSAAILLGISLWIGHVLRHIVVLLGMSFLFTYILLAPVNGVDLLLRRFVNGMLHLTRTAPIARRFPPALPRVVAIMIVYFAFTLAALVFSVRFVPVAAHQVIAFGHETPHLIHKGEDWILNLPFTQEYFHDEAHVLLRHGDAGTFRPTTPPPASTTSPPAAAIDAEGHPAPLSPEEKQVIKDHMFSTQYRVKQLIRGHFSKSMRDVVELLSSTVEGFIYIVTGAVLVFYFLLDGRQLKEGLLQLFPRENRRAFDYFLTNLHTVMFGYVKAHVILGAVTGAYIILVCTFLGIPYAFFLGTFFGAAQIIPVVGPWIGVLPWLLVLHLITPTQLLLVAILVGLFQLLKDTLLAPRVLGHVMGLHPVIVILSLLICAKLAGIFGIVFAIPIASMVNVSIRFIQSYESNTLPREDIPETA